MVAAQVSVCVGCCCGNVARGKPEVPVDRLKQEWRARRLSKFVQLTVSGCLGPCDLVNVVRVSGGGDDIWLGNLRTVEDYLDLADWAERSKAKGTLAPFSTRMLASRFDPFRRGDLQTAASLD
jgi:cobaltochelatase CobN